MRSSEQAQSEIIGFLLIFGLVVLSISLVGVTAFTGLDNAKQFQETTSTEQAFLVLAENIDDTIREGAPSRETEISLSEASLSLEATEQINITVDGETTSIESQPIVYESDDTSISYHSGLLIRDDGGSALSFREPKFVLTSETVVLPIAKTSTTEDRTIAGTSAVQVVTRHNETRVLATEEFDSPATVEINITSPHVDVWAESLESDMDCGDPGDGTVTCSIKTNQVFVSVADIDVELR